MEGGREDTGRAIPWGLLKVKPRGCPLPVGKQWHCQSVLRVTIGCTMGGRQARGMMGGRRLVKRLLYLSMDLVIQDVEHMLPHHAGQTTDPGLGRCT